MIPPEQTCADCGEPLGSESGQYGPDTFLCGPCHRYEQDYQEDIR